MSLRPIVLFISDDSAEKTSKWRQIKMSGNNTSMFEELCKAKSLDSILYFHKAFNLAPCRFPEYYPKIKAKLADSWKAQALFKKFEMRASNVVYEKGLACATNKVLIVGGGPCGLRAAIECQMLGAKVIVIEKRDDMSRNNVLHLWPFVIHDLKALGAKHLYGKFCAGSINHISTRVLQFILLKIALLLGVEFHPGVSFEELLEPTITERSEMLGWRARVYPADHPIGRWEFDCLLGADGKKSRMPQFKKHFLRCKLAIAITANFVNNRSEPEAAAPEISGVSYIFRQKFFNDLNANTGIELENILYYKDDTHYFVMTPKKQSLMRKGVIKSDHADVTQLLSAQNVDRQALMAYAREAAMFATNGLLPLTDFASNHHGEPDIALFDFSTMHASENASVVMERMGRRLLCQLAGDSLLEPFWPMGTGVARGFLSVFDAAWAIHEWGKVPSPHPLRVIAERESIYRLLAQTTPQNTAPLFAAYSIDPGTRYPNLNRRSVTSTSVAHLYKTDDPGSYARRRKRGIKARQKSEDISTPLGSSRCRGPRLSVGHWSIVCPKSVSARKKRRDSQASADNNSGVSEIAKKTTENPSDPVPHTEEVAKLTTTQLSRKPSEPAIHNKWQCAAAAAKLCAVCGKRVYAAESVAADGEHVHKACFRCAVCGAALRPGHYTKRRPSNGFACPRHASVREHAPAKAPSPVASCSRAATSPKERKRPGDELTKLTTTKFSRRPSEPATHNKNKKWQCAAAAAKLCAVCGKRVYAAESVAADGEHVHKACFRCAVCGAALRPGHYRRKPPSRRFVCPRHASGREPVAAKAPTPVSIAQDIEGDTSLYETPLSTLLGKTDDDSWMDTSGEYLDCVEEVIEISDTD